jgi:hypothetical protein
LASRAKALEGGKRGPAIVPGDPGASLLVQAIEFNGELKMPPGGAEKKLAPEAIDTASGVATAVGPPLSTLLDGDAFGFDFNPRANANVGAIRIVSNTGPNLRIHPDTLAVAIDGTLAYATGDANEGAGPSVVAAAYTNSRLGFSGTTLYNIDAGLDIFTRQDPPNAGTQITLASLGINTNDLAGFDILTTGTPEAPVNTAYAAFKESGRTRVKGGCGNSSLVSIDVTNGAVTSLGSIGTNQPIVGLAAYIAP